MNHHFNSKGKLKNIFQRLTIKLSFNIPKILKKYKKSNITIQLTKENGRNCIVKNLEGEDLLQILKKVSIKLYSEKPTSFLHFQDISEAF